MSQDQYIQHNKAYEYAMFLLNIRLRTEGELEEKLRIKNYELGIRQKVIKLLKVQNFINDQRFAETYLENLKKYKTWGYFGIKKKMMEKKLPPDIIESVLSENFNEEEELDIAKKFLQKEFSKAVNTELVPSTAEGTNKAIHKNRSPRFARDDKIKAARKLAAKGFRSSVISKLVV